MALWKRLDAGRLQKERCRPRRERRAAAQGRRGATAVRSCSVTDLEVSSVLGRRPSSPLPLLRRRPFFSRPVVPIMAGHPPPRRNE